jgi:hypothetical protein
MSESYNVQSQGVKFFEKLLQNDQLKECQTLEDAAKTYEVYYNKTETFEGETAGIGCTRPCKQISHSFTLSEFHRNNWVEVRDPHSAEYLDNYYSLFVSFGSMDVEKQVESLIYDAGNFFAAVGGNLGLFLGFSCLSIIFATIDFLVRVFLKI